MATIQESVKWQLLSKALLGSTIQGWPLSKSLFSDNYCQKLFLGALSKGQLGVFKLISIRGTLSKHLYRYLPGRGVGVPGGGSPLAFRTTGILMYVHFLFCQTVEKVIPQMLPRHGGGFVLCLQYTPERIVPLRLRTLATSKTRLCDPASRCTYQYQGPLTVGLLREPV